MRSRVSAQVRPWRWVISLAAILLVVGLAQAALSQVGRPPWLGLTARGQDGKTIVAWVLPASRAWDAGIRPGDEVLAIDERPADAEAAPALLASASAVQTASPSGAVRTAPAGPPWVPANPLHLAAFVALGLSLVAVGAVVFVLARDAVPAGALLAFSLAAATALTVSLGQASGAPWTYAVTYGALVAFGASVLLLFLAFPVNRLAGLWGKRLLVASVAVHLALVGAYAYVLAVDPVAYEVLRKFLFGTLALDLLGAIILAVAAVVRPRPEIEGARRAMRLVAVGALLGFAPIALFSLAPNALGLGFVVEPYVSVLSLVFFPASIGGALLSRELLGIDRFVRRGLVALGVWMALVAVYSGGLYLLYRAEPVTRSPASLPLTIAAIALTFPAIQAVLRRKLEQVLFHDLYSGRDTIREMGRALATLPRLGAIAEYALSRLGETIGLSWAALRLEGSGEPTVFSWGEYESEEGASAAIPLVADDTSIGTLLVGPKRRDVELLPADIDLLDTLAPILATALEKALLLERLEEQVKTLARREHELAALNVRLMHAQEEERARLAMDLHDDPLQRALLLVRDLAGADSQDANAQWRRHAEEIVTSLVALSAGLRPPTLDDLGLPAGLQWLATDVSARSDLSVLLEIRTADGGEFGRLDGELELALYRIAQEALNNCLKHAEANQATVTLRRDSRNVWLELADNGKGYEIGAEETVPPFHFGILGMRERLRPWRGTLKLKRLAQGTCVSAHVPVEEGDEPASE